jgi:gliding motility-associated-like protein
VNLSILHVGYANSSVQICAGQTYQLPSGAMVNAAGIYQDTVRSVHACDSIITTINLSVFPVSHVNSSAEICSNQTYQLPSGAIVNAAGFYQDTIKAVGSCDSIINTIHLLVNDVSSYSIIDSIYEAEPYVLPWGQTINTTGVYQATLTNSLGCDSVITVTLKPRTQLSSCITLTSAFTPNGDGINDHWILYKYNCFKKLEVSVYNRYGSLVYHSDDYKNDWTGKYKNKELPDGTYYYIVKLYKYDDHLQVFKNNLTILR